MHIMRWLLSHPLITLWILTLIAILLNLNVNTAHDSHAKEETAAQLPTQAGTISTHTASVQPSTAATTQQPQNVATAATLSQEQLDLLRQARNAYWNAELEQALGLYTHLIEQVPASVGYKGELANVYWKLGRQQEAASIYAEIVLPLWQQGQHQQVVQILPVLDQYYPAKAAEVRAQMGQ